MNFFKKFGKFFIILTIVLFIPASSYAIVDASIFGGRTFGSKIENAAGDTDVNGWQYGLYGHVNTGVPMLFTVGAGGFFLTAPLKGDIDATKKTVGFDAFAMVDLPVLPVFPYVRYGIAVKETVEVKTSAGTTSSSENFKSNYFGFGLSRTIFSAVKLKLQIFAEYLYTISKQENDTKLKGHAVNVGITAMI
jgi:hypothetical protein